MFLGHFGLGMAAKKAVPVVSLGTLFLAAQFIDLLWPFFLLFGIETVAIEPGNTRFTPLNFISYPFSHSLLAVIGWAILFSVIYYLIKKNGKTAITLGLLVVSHWFLDLIVHRPDLPLAFNEETKWGFGLWNYPFLTLIIEILLFVLGIYLYLQSTISKNKTGIYAFWGLIIFFMLIYVMNAAGNPPPNSEMIGYVGLAQWLFIIWGYWIDRNRESRHNYFANKPHLNYT